MTRIECWLRRRPLPPGAWREPAAGVQSRRSPGPGLLLRRVLGPVQRVETALSLLVAALASTRAMEHTVDEAH